LLPDKTARPLGLRPSALFNDCKLAVLGTGIAAINVKYIQSRRNVKNIFCVKVPGGKAAAAAI
jgi:hypothetical protein